MSREPEKIKVLIIDEEKQDLEKFQRILTREGFYVEGFLQVDKALNALKEKRFQIILIDLKFAEEDPEEVLQKIRKSDTDVCIIVTTSSPSTDMAVTALRYSAFDFVSKPLEAEDLNVIMDKAVEEKGLVLDFEKRINLVIGNKMRNLRKENKLTLRQLANRTGLSISLISQIERAKSSSSVSTLYKVATALGVSLAYFFEDL